MNAAASALSWNALNIGVAARRGVLVPARAPEIPCKHCHGRVGMKSVQNSASMQLCARAPIPECLPRQGRSACCSCFQCHMHVAELLVRASKRGAGALVCDRVPLLRDPVSSCETRCVSEPTSPRSCLFSVSSRFKRSPRRISISVGAAEQQACMKIAKQRWETCIDRFRSSQGDAVGVVDVPRHESAGGMTSYTSQG